MPDASTNDGALDIERLMDELRQRVQEKKARGLYRVDELVSEALEGDEPWDAQRLEELHGQALIEQKLITHESTRPVVGSFIEAAKRFVVKAGWHNLHNVTEQATSFNAGMISYSASIGTEVSRLRTEIERLRADTGPAQLADLEARLSALEIAALDDRVERLERRLDGQGPAEPPLRAAGESLDWLRLDAWLDAGGVASLAEAVAGRSRALHLNCGAGEILDGIAGVGVDGRGDLVAKGRAAGREVIHADPVGYVASADGQSHDAVTAADLVEQLTPEALGALLRGAASALSAGGVIAVSVRNPASDEERQTFWRDPRRRRPVDPSTVAFLLECEGFTEVEMRWDEAAGNAAPRSCVVVAQR